ncbi:unnamed protein product [Tenebrio molitor]|nr:unnamed protein product [Tenebrio molitor]
MQTLDYVTCYDLCSISLFIKCKTIYEISLRRPFFSTK